MRPCPRSRTRTRPRQRLPKDRPIEDLEREVLRMAKAAGFHDTEEAYARLDRGGLRGTMLQMNLEMLQFLREGRARRVREDEILVDLERAARRETGRSARSVIRAYREGKLEDPGACIDTLSTAGLLPKDHKLFVEP